MYFDFAVVPGQLDVIFKNVIIRNTPTSDNTFLQRSENSDH